MGCFGRNSRVNEQSGSGKAVGLRMLAAFTQQLFANPLSRAL